MSLMRTYRRALGLSQSAFAAQLNVPLETYRPWDAGRREPPPQLLTRARTLAGYPDETVLLPLPVLALMIGVHVRTLHAAARSGRLGVAYETRTTLRREEPRRTSSPEELHRLISGAFFTLSRLDCRDVPGWRGFLLSCGRLPGWRSLLLHRPAFLCHVSSSRTREKREYSRPSLSRDTARSPVSRRSHAKWR